MFRIRGPLIALFAILSSCAWEQKVVFSAGSEGGEVKILQPFPANGWGIRVRLNSKGHEKTLYELRGDVFLDFADVAWSKSNGTVAVFTCGTPPIRLAYSLIESSFIPFSKAEHVVAAHIRDEYHLAEQETSDNETFDWACSSEGRTAFLKLHPSSAPR